MEWTPVISSNIAAIKYNDNEQVLAVKFNNSTIYHYFGVPSYHFDNLLDAPSVGKYLNANIKGSYNYQKIR